MGICPSDLYPTSMRTWVEVIPTTRPLTTPPGLTVRRLSSNIASNSLAPPGLAPVFSSSLWAMHANSDLFSFLMTCFGLLAERFPRPLPHPAQRNLSPRHLPPFVAAPTLVHCPACRALPFRERYLQRIPRAPPCATLHSAGAPALPPKRRDKSSRRHEEISLFRCRALPRPRCLFSPACAVDSTSFFLPPGKRNFLRPFD